MFVDEVTLTVVAGRGGNGMLSFRREKYVPFGGPDGGNGGTGGNVIFRSATNVDTLSDFRMKKVFRAVDGIRGGAQRCDGKNAPSLILQVPVGTVVYDAHTKELLYDFAKDGEECVIATGGRGGYGNAHFVSSTRQAPKFAELGDRGETKTVTLVLKLVADVGIIGLPNAGKSTLISHISAARPKIANYPFTTLVPNLGIVEHKGVSFVVSDNPGLIEGAATGKGLGIEFLKHIERTRMLLHLLDGTDTDPYRQYQLINRELKKYHTARLKKKLGVGETALELKQQIVVVNKADLLSDDQREKIRKTFAKGKITSLFFISAATGQGITALLDTIVQTLVKVPRTPLFLPPPEKLKVFRPHLENPHYFEVVKKKKQFIICGQRIEQIARMTPPGNREALERIYDVFKKTGIARELTRQGAQDGDTIVIAGLHIAFREE